MNYELAMMMNWLLVAAGLLMSDLFANLFDGSDDGADDPIDIGVTETLLSFGDDDFTGTDGPDRILGLAGNDQLFGGDGDDVIEGNIGDDVVFGGAGDDRLAGGGDTDQLFGGAGNDQLSSDRLDADADWTRGNAEVLDGGDGNDALTFSGDDTATGGAGDDSFVLVADSGDAAGITDFAPGKDTLVIYVEGLDDADTAPVVDVTSDTDTMTTRVILDGTPVLELAGVFSETDLGVTLADLATLDLANA